MTHYIVSLIKLSSISIMKPFNADTFIQLMAQAEHRKQMPLKCKCSFLIITNDIVRFVFGHIMNQEGTHELKLVGRAKLFFIMI